MPWMSGRNCAHAIHKSRSCSYRGWKNTWPHPTISTGWSWLTDLIVRYVSLISGNCSLFNLNTTVFAIDFLQNQQRTPLAICIANWSHRRGTLCTRPQFAQFVLAALDTVSPAFRLILAVLNFSKLYRFIECLLYCISFNMIQSYWYI